MLARRQGLNSLRFIRAYHHEFKRKPDQGGSLYVHQVPPDARHSLSYYLSLSKDPHSIIMGTVNLAMDDKDKFFQLGQILPNQFDSNPDFITLLHKTFNDHVHGCPVLGPMAEAEASKSSAFFHCHDLRCPPQYGRIAEVEDIIGTIRVAWNEKLRNGKIIQGSYEPNTMYRLVSTNGILQTSDYMGQKLLEACEGETK